MDAIEDTFVLCVDLDGCCAWYEQAIKIVVARELGRDPDTMSLQDDWQFEKLDWGIADRAQFLELHTMAVAEGMFRTMPEIPGASDALWELSDEGVHIRIVTHRFVHHWAHDQVATDTTAWLQEKRPDGRPRIPYRDLCFLGQKSDVAGDVIIEDAPHNIEALWAARDHGKPAPQPIVFDQAYNRHVAGPRAYNWDDVKALVRAKRVWKTSDPLARDNALHAPG